MMCDRVFFGEWKKRFSDSVNCEKKLMPSGWKLVLKIFKKQKWLRENVMKIIQIARFKWM